MKAGRSLSGEYHWKPTGAVRKWACKVCSLEQGSSKIPGCMDCQGQCYNADSASVVLTGVHVIPHCWDLGHNWNSEALNDCRVWSRAQRNYVLELAPVASQASWIISLSYNLVSKIELVTVFLLPTSLGHLESVDKQCAFQKGSTQTVETEERCKASNITHL